MKNTFVSVCVSPLPRPPQVFGRGQSIPGAETMLTKPVEKQHTDTVVNFLIRIACQVASRQQDVHSPCAGSYVLYFCSLTLPTK